MSKIYAISDIHGCNNTFNEMLNQIGLNKEDKLYLLGDYIDRGPGSIATIDKIIELKESGYNINCLTGNHEQMMLHAINEPREAMFWINNGGDAVIEELGVYNSSQVPQKYINFANELKYFIETEDFIFVHAGLNLRKTNPLTDKESLIWIRYWENHELLDEFLQGKKVIHGHTPQTKDEIIKRFNLFSQNYHSVLNIDNGCVFKREGYNNLCCVDLTNNKLFFQQNCD